MKLSQEAEGLGKDLEAGIAGLEDWDSAAGDKYEEMLMDTVGAADSLSGSLEIASEDVDHIFQGNDLT